MAESSDQRSSTPDTNEGGVPRRPPAEGGDEQVVASLAQQEAEGSSRSGGAGASHGEVVEPPNSTVNDWHGQKVADDALEADAFRELEEAVVDLIGRARPRRRRSRPKASSE
jgi:hypothetical protein